MSLSLGPLNVRILLTGYTYAQAIQADAEALLDWEMLSGEEVETIVADALGRKL